MCEALFLHEYRKVKLKPHWDTLHSIEIRYARIKKTIGDALPQEKSRDQLYYELLCAYPLPPMVDFRTSATADAERRSLCLLMASNAFSSRSLLLSANTIDSKISVTSSFTSVTATLKLNNGADLSFTEFLFSLELAELDLSLEDIPLAPMPLGLANFICLCCERIGLLLLLSDTAVAIRAATTKIMKKNFETNILSMWLEVD